jgi:hypothetical protein
MKTKRAIYIFFFCVVAMLMQAQVHTGRESYFSEGSTWTEFTLDTHSDPTRYVNSNQYFLSNDTLINGMPYRNFFYRDSQQLYYIGALREGEGKVYAKLENYGEDSGEFLLYDFTLKKGDRIISSASEGILSVPEGLVVTKIDTIWLLNGESRKRFHFDRTAAWIEGVGSVGGFLNDTYWHISGFSEKILACFKQDNTQLYKDEVWCKSYDCCDIVSGIPQNKQKSGISFSGNTVKDNLSIYITGEVLNAPLSIYVINLAGNTICVKQAKGAKHVGIDFSGYKPGVYFVNVEAPGIRYSYKIVKI